MSLNHSKKLIVIAGPTAVGKTDFAIQLAKYLETEIISADSRQMYKELTIGTAKPDTEQLKQVKHHFVDNISIHDYYSAARFELEVMELLSSLFKDRDYVVMVGGSGLYIDAVCEGIDELPDIDENLRKKLNLLYKNEGLEAIRNRLKELDPEFYEIIDQSNPKRIIRALEVCMATGIKYSEQRTNIKKKREFEIIKVALNSDRKILYDRINERVDQMINDGLIEEAECLYDFRNLNALNTVGYKELFDYFSADITLEKAIENIKTSSRRYAKRQLTWFRKNPSYQWFHPSELEKVIKLC
ncbi:MAG: tRNA (adenosine(37)-N6)-dimethylallyltransferase MiaA [Bacteroidetes bacterium HGW-Bacteroidetes-17]|jgi:tRNA dimethylallyltransferase|nr:MAG: tRNA (adenosine(37)-N6)-dimethylallyltransferase MiaA [Bacteroidetes bacterium HGW-Bacteroidetes-17]